MVFNNRLKKLRLDKGVTQVDVAEYLGITKQGYNKYEKGNTTPSVEVLKKISVYFDVSVDFLLCVKRKSATSNIELIAEEARRFLIDCVASDEELEAIFNSSVANSNIINVADNLVRNNLYSTLESIKKIVSAYERENN